LLPADHARGGRAPFGFDLHPKEYTHADSRKDGDREKQNDSLHDLSL
jgi:hypothetical protein